MAGPRTSARRRSPRSDGFTIAAHLILVAALSASFATGLAIALDSQASIVIHLARFLARVPKGSVIEWHLAAGLIVAAMTIAYGLFLVLTRRRHALSLRFWTERVRRGGPEIQAAARLYGALLIHLGGVILLGLAITGVLLYRGDNWPLPASRLGAIHGALAVVLIAYVALHVWSQAEIGGLLRLARPRNRYAQTALLALSVGVVAIGLLVVTDRSASHRLVVPGVGELPALDGSGSDPVWARAPPVRISTVRGANFDDGHTMIELRAVHDGNRIAFLVRWDDTTESTEHLPLIRTADGWRIDMDGFLQADETAFYEDKLALLFSRSPAIGSGTARLGTGLVPGPHRTTGRGLHFSDGELLDLWHWKSLRTGLQSPGFADDNHIGPPLPSVQPDARYTGGYQPDDGPAGYHLNVCLIDDPDCQQTVARFRATGRFEPVAGSTEKRLARCLQQGNECARFLVPLFIPVDDQPWTGVLRPEAATLFDPAAVSVPTGTRIPGIVVHDRVSGDRGDVRAAGRWDDGRWSVELQRSLATGSDQDLPLRIGEPVFLWVAAFDSSQTRHTRHLRPVTLVLEPLR